MRMLRIKAVVYGMAARTARVDFILSVKLRHKLLLFEF